MKKLLQDQERISSRAPYHTGSKLITLLVQNGLAQWETLSQLLHEMNIPPINISTADEERLFACLGERRLIQANRIRRLLDTQEIDLPDAPSELSESTLTRTCLNEFTSWLATYYGQCK